MKLIWTRSSSPLSKLIRWVSGEPVSHFAIVFDGKLVFQSNLVGVGLAWYDTFAEANTIVEQLEWTNLGLAAEEQWYQGVLDTYTGKSYDLGGLAYFLYRGLLWKFFKRPLPAKNAWASDDAFLCTELVYALPLKPMGIPVPEHLDLVTPWQLYQIMNASLPKQATP